MAEAGLRAHPRRGTSLALHRLERFWAWRERRSPARVGTLQALAWMVATATLFVLMSNPLVLVENFYASMYVAFDVTWVVCLVTLPWLRPPQVSIPVGLFLAFAGLSTLWSINAGDTRGTVQLYTQIALMALLVVGNTRAAVLCHGVTLGGVAVVALSWWAHVTERPGAVLAPGDVGYLAGIGTNRNILAYTLVLSLCFALASVPRGRVGRVLWGAALLTILAGIWLAESGTGLTVAPVLLMVALALRLTRRGADGSRRRPSLRARIASWSALLAVGVTLALRPELLGTLLGRDSTTLSGRVPFWTATLEELDDRAVQGYGWGAVWPHPWQQAWVNNVFDRIYFNAGYPLNHGHNSLVDLAPQVGLVGVLAYLAILVAALWASVLAFRAVAAADTETQSDSDDHLVTARLAVLASLGLVLYGITEPLSTIPLGWFSLVLVAGLSARTARAVRVGRAAATPRAAAEPRASATT